ncbi:hypothetical protein CN878_08865 [Ochrobactrum sp. 695/2009]|nr:hypothetical protein [Brucella intermedia]PJR94785.1 hypothetical protein CN881_04200 [Ochrobactrum sp. 721/2009]PJT13902.1 hypothetical protein CN880_22005 [Ochrobactrum sp. 720/2009]PJT20798.1 hypothetical protein CN879_14890 [Ochrobactrum sp. 715/2009]PJT31404.1 hypothetical protein CN878_08865 [Ochrobactrum sp. 695/2009]PJT33430.1 hypothetical protein CN877_18870 [Ochrobactrum sp. 689/2009]
MSARYAIRNELADGTLLDPSVCLPNKTVALRVARRVAKGILGADVVRVWVDDTKTDLGVASFEVK